MSDNVPHVVNLDDVMFVVAVLVERLVVQRAVHPVEQPVLEHHAHHDCERAGEVHTNIPISVEKAEGVASGEKENHGDCIGTRQFRAGPHIGIQ